MKTMRKWRRREVLTALGLGTGSMFLPSLATRSARGDSPQIPRRIVFFVSEHQIVGDAWQMLRGNPDATAFQYPLDDPDPASFSEILRPLHPWRDRLLLIDGVSYLSGVRNNVGEGNGHIVSHLTALTGAEMLSSQAAGSASIDQVIAGHVAQPGRIPSLELACGNPFTGGFVNTGPGARAPVERSPAAVFNRLFPADSPETDEPTVEELVQARRENVLDFARGEYEALLPRLSTEDRHKLELHRDLVSDLQSQIAGLADVVCERPEHNWTGQWLSPRTIYSQMAMLTASALACDITRVVTLQVTQLTNGDFGAPPGDVHQDISHAATAEPAKSRMVDYNVAHTEMFVELLNLLDSFPEGNGTMLDNTLVVWMPEHAHRKLEVQGNGLDPDYGSPHNLLEIPIVLAGNAGGYFDTGRYVSLEREPIELSFYSSLTGPAHNKLLVSLARAMGLDIDTAGGVTQRSIAGRTYDFTGPLSL